MIQWNELFWAYPIKLPKNGRIIFNLALENIFSRALENISKGTAKSNLLGSPTYTELFLLSTDIAKGENQH